VGISLNIGQESFRYEPLFRTAGGTLVMKSRAETPTTEGGSSGSGSRSSPTPPPLSPKEKASSSSTSSSGHLRRSSSGRLSISGSKSQAAYYLPVMNTTISPCLDFDGKGNIEIPFHQLLRLNHGLTVEALVRIEPPIPPSTRSFLFGSAGKREGGGGKGR